MPIELSVEELMLMVGQKTVEVYALTKENNELKAQVKKLKESLEVAISKFGERLDETV
jgi:hypothetical protein